VLKGLLCFGLLLQSPSIKSQAEPIIADQVFAGIGIVSAVGGALGGYLLTGNSICAVSGAIVGACLVKGVHNIRYYDQILSQCELDYGFVPHVDWLEYPLQFGQNIVCMDQQPLDTVSMMHHGLCMSEIQNKIKVFNAIDTQIIWSFEKFKDTFPHTNAKANYSVSKSYLGAFGYKTLGDLKTAISSHLAKIKYDFNSLKKLTNLSWVHTVIPTNMSEFTVLENRLASYNNYYGAYTWYGAFGYSSIHNGKRAKICLLSLAKIYAFLMNLQELLNTCTDSDDTQLTESQGVLNFSLQHVHYVQKK
jgi:hypothetical protein